MPQHRERDRYSYILLHVVPQANSVAIPQIKRLENTLYTLTVATSSNILVRHSSTDVLFSCLSNLPGQPLFQQDWDLRDVVHSLISYQ